MGAHEWIDIADRVGLAAVTIIAVFLGNRLSRHDSERQNFQSSLSELKQDVAEIKGFLKGTFKF